jgi:hypothetical protein
MLIIIFTEPLPHGVRRSWIAFHSKPKVGGFQLGLYECIELGDAIDSVYNMDATNHLVYFCVAPTLDLFSLLQNQ